MKKKIFVRGPVLSQSGYGEQSRFALRALRSREDLFDIYIQPIPWGKTGWIWENSEFRQWMDERVNETAVLGQQQALQPDISLQITIPNEFQKMCPINIGYTAGIETSKVAPQWLEKGNEMDKVLVVSNHARETYTNTAYEAKNSQTGEVFPYRMETPVEVVWENTPRAESEPIEDFELPCDFNFLMVSQISPRKNFANALKWWVEEFIDQEVGLVLKSNIKCNSSMDFEAFYKSIKNLLSAYPDRKCKVHILHGDLTAGQMTSLYTHPKIKAIVNIAHGEGFGLPLYEAAREGLPVVTIGWSGQLDFLTHDGEEMFQKVDYTLGPVQQQAHWEGVIQKDSMWAYADQGSYKMTLRKTYKTWHKAKETAEKLKASINERFSDEVLYERFCNAILGKPNLKPEVVNGISFCISTNGAKPEKTIVEINSIKNTMAKANIPHQIIIAGDTENFKEIEGVTLVHTPEDAHSGLLAKLRNNAGEKIEQDVVVFVDDDFVFPEDWATRLVEYSKTNGWDVTANKIFLPDGGRFWDRATINPHKLVSYDHPTYDRNLYQTGGFWVMRKEIYNKFNWDSSIPINAEKKGKPNEDIEMSFRMHKNGIMLCFDDQNTVWHNDDSYTEFRDLTLKKSIVEEQTGFSHFVDPCDQFLELLDANK